MHLRAFAAIVSAAIAFGVGIPASAQDAPSCADIAPRDAAFFEQIAATPLADAGAPQQASPVASPSVFTMPEGEAAGDEVVAEVTTLYQQLISCLNAGEYLRVCALYTDDYLLRTLGADAIESLDATPVPAEEAMQSEFGGVLDARRLEDGRVAALVTISNPQSGDVVLFTLLEQGETGWLIDDETVVEVEEQASAESAAATPAG